MGFCCFCLRVFLHFLLVILVVLLSKTFPVSMRASSGLTVFLFAGLRFGVFHLGPSS